MSDAFVDEDITRDQLNRALEGDISNLEYLIDQMDYDSLKEKIPGIFFSKTTVEHIDLILIRYPQMEYFLLEKCIGYCGIQIIEYFHLRNPGLFNNKEIITSLALQCFGADLGMFKYLVDNFLYAHIDQIIAVFFHFACEADRMEYLLQWDSYIKERKLELDSIFDQDLSFKKLRRLSKIITLLRDYGFTFYFKKQDENLMKDLGILGEFFANISNHD